MKPQTREDAEWTLDMADVDSNIAHLLHQIRRLKSLEARRDLLKLHRNVEELRENISREAVRCRGFNRTTGTMQDLQKSIADATRVLTQMLTMALLMD